MHGWTLSADQLAALDSIRPRVGGRRHDDPVKAERRARRDRAFAGSVINGLRHSRRTPIYCT